MYIMCLGFNYCDRNVFFTPSLSLSHYMPATPVIQFACLYTKSFRIYLCKDSAV